MEQFLQWVSLTGFSEILQLGNFAWLFSIRPPHKDSLQHCLFVFPRSPFERKSLEHTYMHTHTHTHTPSHTGWLLTSSQGNRHLYPMQPSSQHHSKKFPSDLCSIGVLCFVNSRDHTSSFPRVPLEAPFPGLKVKRSNTQPPQAWCRKDRALTALSDILCGLDVDRRSPVLENPLRSHWHALHQQPSTSFYDSILLGSNCIFLTLWGLCTNSEMGRDVHKMLS